MSGFRLLLDQMLDQDVAETLSRAGHDVLRVSQVGMQEADDAEVLAKAMETNRVLVTLDEHFGDWVLLPLASHPGVIRVKANPACTGVILSVLLPFLASCAGRDLSNKLVIVSTRQVRWISTSF